MNPSGPFLPAVHRPPHDPTSLLLDARAGWRTALGDGVEIRTDGRLSLARLPGARRSFDEPGGSLGGLTLPANVALGPDGGLYLLDPAGPTLRRFDPCACRFEDVPCFGGQGAGPRQLSGPLGIAIYNGNLYVCDAGNHRVSVFTLRGFALRGHWKPPASTALTNDWTPNDIAFDAGGRAYVSDPANGCIHRFDAAGRWMDSLSGFGAVTRLATDCRDRLYACVEGPPAAVSVVDSNGNAKTVTNSPETLAASFPALPLTVDAQGRLHLESQCPPPEDSGAPPGSYGVFDLHGVPVDASVVSAPVLYCPSGSFTTQALDSRLYRCVWHRVILHGEIPAGCRITVSTFTAEAELSASDLANLEPDRWQTRQAASPGSGGGWDCLVRSPAGRFLWLRLEFRGTGRETPHVDGIEIEFPRLSPRRYLPAVFGAEPVSADFTDRFLSLFDTTLRGMEYRIDSLGRYFDPLSAPDGNGADFLAWLGSWIGVTLDRRWPEGKRREFLKRAGGWFRLRGTREGLWRILVFYLGMEPCRTLCGNAQPKTRCAAPNRNCAPAGEERGGWRPPPLILEHFRIRRWLFLGQGRLSDQAVLWGKGIVDRSQLDENAQADRTKLITTPDPYHDPFLAYAHAFTVFVPAACGATEQSRKTLETLLKAEIPAHTQCSVRYVAPRFRVGIQATIGFDSAVARITPGVTLARGALGKDAVLADPPNRRGGPGFELGRDPRVGTTTVLD